MFLLLKKVERRRVLGKPPSGVRNPVRNDCNFEIYKKSKKSVFQAKTQAFSSFHGLVLRPVTAALAEDLIVVMLCFIVESIDPNCSPSVIFPNWSSGWPSSIRLSPWGRWSLGKMVLLENTNFAEFHETIAWILVIL